MSLLQVPAAPVPAPAKPSRYAYADNLKVLLVVGVIVAHATMAWTDNEAWVLEEPPVREPLLTLLNLAALVGVLFAMATFFLIAGAFTPRSLARKGLRRFLVDRTVRLGVPLLFFLLALAPFVEYADTSNTGGWDKGIPSFVTYIWRHPSPGPTWFLEVLLLLSVGYALIRTVLPRRTTAPEPVRGRYLLAAAVFVAIMSYLIRFAVPLGEELHHVPQVRDIFAGQAPAWVIGFALGVAGAERGWFDRISPAMSRRLCYVAWSATAGVLIVATLTVGAMGADVEELFGGGTWQSLVLAVLEGAIVATMPMWLFDVFRRRVNHQGRLMRAMGRAAFAAFILHQLVLVGTVLATRYVAWPPEVEFLAATALGVIGSFGIGALLVRLPGVSRIL
jgi:fucose 4-O-acetylase-like acetyltransferase